MVQPKLYLTNLKIVSFLDSDKMKQIEKATPLSKYLPEKLYIFFDQNNAERLPI
jgi:hypothetical protein